ncbi:MAG TPA: AraC family transcriptional regulator [Verrucomicrobiae bacterium]|nr:AraC family transcriptional regulator [Verrucomicrobiae bacterium]
MLDHNSFSKENEWRFWEKTCIFWLVLLDEIKPRIVFGTSWGSPLGRVVLAGLLRHHTGVPERPLRKLGNYALVYLLNGKGYFQDARGLRRTLLPGDFWFLFPDVPHWYGPGKGSYWDELYIVFTGPLFDLWRSKGLLDPAAPILHLEPVDYWLRRIEEVIVAKADPLQQICSLQLLFAEVLQASGGTSKPEWVARALTLLQDGVEPLEKVARMSGMSYDTFRKRFASATGVSPGRYRRMKLIDKACALMISGLTNKEIAERLAICDEFHFSRQFKKIMGLTTAQFRLKMPKR